MKFMMSCNKDEIEYGITSHHNLMYISRNFNVLYNNIILLKVGLFIFVSEL